MENGKGKVGKWGKVEKWERPNDEKLENGNLIFHLNISDGYSLMIKS